MAGNAFVRDTALTAVAIAYRNPDISLIADAVMPYVGVGKKTFEFYEYPTGQGFQQVDTTADEYAAVAEVRMTGTKVARTCTDRGLAIPLTNDDIAEAPPEQDMRAIATQQSTQLLLLDREQRVAAAAFDENQYDAGHKATLSGTGQWSNDASKPVKAIKTAFDGCLMRPNVLVLGQEVWSALQYNPEVISSCLGQNGGVVTRERLAEVLEVAEIVVGQGYVNVAKPGKPVQLARVWGKHALGIYRNRDAATNFGVTFGFTARLNNAREASVQQVPAGQMGLRGGIKVLAGETALECIVAPEAAFFWKNAVA